MRARLPFAPHCSGGTEQGQIPPRPRQHRLQLRRLSRMADTQTNFRTSQLSELTPVEGARSCSSWHYSSAKFGHHTERKPLEREKKKAILRFLRDVPRAPHQKFFDDGHSGFDGIL